jgi:hypothetical protein
VATFAYTRTLLKPLRGSFYRQIEVSVTQGCSAAATPGYQQDYEQVKMSAFHGEEDWSVAH